MKQKILSGAALLFMVATLTYCGKDDDNSTTTTPEVVKEMTLDEVETDFNTELTSNNVVAEIAAISEEMPEIPENFVSDLIKAGKQNPANKTTSGLLCDQYYTVNASTTAVLSPPIICGQKPKISIDLSTGNIYGCYDFPTDGSCNRNGKILKSALTFKIKIDGKMTFIFNKFGYGDVYLSGEMTVSRTTEGGRTTTLNNLVIEEGNTKITRTATITEKGKLAVDENGAPVYEVDADGNFIIKDGNKVQAYDYEVSINSVATFPDGGTNSIKVTKTLYTKANCKGKLIGGAALAVFGKAIAGEIEMRMRGNTIKVDFGDRTCNAKWTVYKDGKSKVIHGE